MGEGQGGWGSDALDSGTEGEVTVRSAEGEGVARRGRSASEAERLIQPTLEGGGHSSET